MSEGLKRLKAEGAQKIYETTHISRKNIEAIFTGNYDEMTKVQLNGFLSILEGEYKVDLSAVKADYLSRQESVEETEKEKEKKEESLDITAISEHPKQKNSLIIAAIVVIAVIMLLIQFSDGDATVAEDELNASLVAEEVVTGSLEANASAEEEAVLIPPEPALPYQLVIEPKTKLWMGYIDLETLKRYTELTKESIELDTEKGWLLVFGHGHFDVHIGDEVIKFSDKNKVRLIYEEGKIREIDVTEFKERNRGDNW